MKMDVGHAVLRRTNETDGRFGFVTNDEALVTGLVMNSPWPIAGHLPVAVMTDAVRAFLTKPAQGATSERLHGLFEYLAHVLDPLDPRLHPQEKGLPVGDQPGYAAFLFADASGVRVGRVGDLRVSVCVNGRVRTLLVEHNLGVMANLANGPCVSPDPRLSIHHNPHLNVISGSLGMGLKIPADAIAQEAIDAPATFFIGTSPVMRHIPETAFRDAGELDPTQAAQKLVTMGLDACRDADGERYARTGAVLCARVSA